MSAAAQPQPAGMRWTEHRIVPAVLFGAAFVVTLFQLPAAHFGTGFETVAVARNLAERGAFANPFAPHLTGPTAHVSPLYPAFLAVLLAIFGYTVWFATAASLCMLAVHGIHAALLPYVSSALFGDRRPGIAAAVLQIALPVFFFFPQFEVMYAATGGMAFCLAVPRLLRLGSSGMLAAGLLAGLLALLNPALLAIAIPRLLFGARKNRPFVTAGVALLGIALVTAPWTWRNWRELRAPIFVRSNLGLEIHLANNDLAEGSFARNEANGVHANFHPGTSASEAALVRALGEAEYNRNCMRMALRWIRAHPARFFRLTATRTRMFWFPDADYTPWHARTRAFLSLGCAAGLLWMLLRRVPAAWWMVAVLVLYPALYYLVQADPRYSAPILWIPLLATGYVLVSAAPLLVRRLR
jgi:hypothetical protein